MNLDLQNAAFRKVESLLEATSGEETALTISVLCEQTGIDRRAMEELLQVRLPEFHFLVVSTGHGYFRPVTADEINHCLTSLQSRAVNLFMRKRTIIQNALKAGYRREGKRFVERQQRQFRDDLFATNGLPPFDPATERRTA